MKRVMGFAALLLAEVFLFPLLFLGRSALENGGTVQAEETPTETVAVTETAAAEMDTGAETLSWDGAQEVRVLDGDTVTVMSLSDYLWGVLAAEMPASFELEALKAQAVAIRSETLYRMAHPSDSHPDADVCTDYGCCQAYTTAEAAAEKWGNSAAEYQAKLWQAVEETDGIVVKYGGEVIQAVFHSSSAGHTLSAAEVWGGDVPYLQEVDSPEGEEVPNYYSVVTVTGDEFLTTVQEAYPGINLEGTPEQWDYELVYNENGTLTGLTIGGVTLAATEVRTLFGLRSASFALETDSESVTFYVTGYGHGVGLSQYGANELAREGYTYEEILTWYYTDVTVEPAEQSDAA